MYFTCNLIQALTNDNTGQTLELIHNINIKKTAKLNKRSSSLCVKVQVFFKNHVETT